MGWPPGLAALTKWWPGKKRGFAIGFLNAFSGFGQAAADCAILVAYAWFPKMGWKAGFVIPPLFPLIVLVLYLLCAKTTPAKAGLPDYEEQDPDKTAAEQEMREIIKSKGALYPYWYVLSNRKFLIWIVIAFCAGLARYGLSTWIPLYFTQKGFSAASSVASSVILPVGMGIGTLVVPWLTDRFCPNDRMPAAIISAVVGAAVQSVVYGFVLNNSGWGIVFVSITVFNLMIAVLGVIGSGKKTQQKTNCK